MDLAIEANRNSALFNTMQDVLDVYNPLLHKARPTIVNQTKHRIRVQPTRWANTLSQWNGQQSVRFDLPRIGSLVDFSLKCAFKIPGVAPTDAQRQATGDRGFARESLTTGGLTNVGTPLSVEGATGNSSENHARGRLDRVYADRLLGFNMIRQYTISSKSRQIFQASGEYLLVRFSQMDEDMKKSVMEACTPVDIMSPDIDDMFYSPGMSYVMNIPLFMFFNEHITSALDVNFSEEVHIDIELRAPSALFYYGQLGDLTQRNPLAQLMVGANDRVQAYEDTTNPLTTGAGLVTWDQGIHDASNSTPIVLAIGAITNPGGAGALATVVATAHNVVVGNEVTITNATSASGDYNGTFVVTSVPTANSFTYILAVATSSPTITTVPAYAVEDGVGTTMVDLTDHEITLMQDVCRRHIQGVGSLLDDWGAAYGSTLGLRTSGPTFHFKDVDNNGESVVIQFEANADYIVQDTDAYRALRQQMFPEGTGLTTITYDTAQEVFHNLMGGDGNTTLLDARSGGSFSDPSQSASGINIGDTTRFVDLPIRTNTLAMASHFMVRKHSDLTGTGNTVPSLTQAPWAVSGALATTKNVLGSHHIYTRCLPVHYFQVLAAGRVIYESDGDSQMKLTQSGMYNGTGMEWGTKTSTIMKRNNTTFDRSASNARPFNVYSINWGLQASRLENSGCLSFQNLNNPTLRIFFKPETWAEYSPVTNAKTTGAKSDALAGAEMGVQVDLIHEHFNVITINSGNGEITSGLNQ
jgi:hypothetical protein